MIKDLRSNSELNFSDGYSDDNDNSEKIKRIIIHRGAHLSERKLPLFLPNSNSIAIGLNIQSEIEETKSKIIKNFENMKLFKIYSLEDIKKEDENHFNIYNLINERKNIRNKILLLGNNLESDVLHLIECLSIEPCKRTRYEHKYIKQYLMKTSLMQSLLNLNENKRNISKIINKVCLNLKYKFLYSGVTIFEINSVPDNYYYLIEGKVRALKPEKIPMTMTGFEYFKYIMRLKRENEDHLISLILKNQINLYIYKNDLPILNYVFFLIIFREYYSNVNFRFYFKYELDDKGNEYESYLEKMIDLCFCSKEELLKDIDFKKNDIEHKTPMIELEQKIRKNIPEISDDLLNYYHQMATDKKKFDLILYKYKSVVDLKKGSFFGESIKKNSLRTYTVKTVEDCHLSYIEIEIYDSFLKKEREKVTEQMIDYLYTRFFLNNITETEFKNHFFSSFVFEVKELGYKLTEQEKKIDYIYFIREGEISVNCSFSINALANGVLMLLKEHTLMKNNEKFIELMSELEEFVKSNRYDLNIINFTSLFIATSTSIIGLDSFCFGFDNYLYESLVISSSVKYFKIEKKYLLNILKEYSTIKEIAEKEAIQKVLLIIDRFIKSLKMKIQNENNTILLRQNYSDSILSKNYNENIKNDEKSLEKNIKNLIKNDYDENISINNSKILNKCIINYNNKEKPIIEKGNKSELSLNQKLSFDGKKMKPLSKNQIEKNMNKSPDNYLENLKKRRAEFSSLKHKLNPISIKKETILVNILQKNIENNLLFSKSKKKIKILKFLSNNNSLKSDSLTAHKNLKIKLNPLNNKNDNSPKKLKYNNSSKQVLLNNTTEKNNFSSFCKSFRSIQLNDNKNKNFINESKSTINLTKDIMSPKSIFNTLNINSRNSIKQNNSINNISNIKSNNNFSPKNNLSPIHKNNKKQKNIFNGKYFSIDNGNSSKIFSSRLNISKSKINNILNHKKKKKLNKKLAFQKVKNLKYKFLKNKILEQDYGIINDFFK